jgi:hypothetical protein
MDVFIPALISALLLLVMHWFPWRAWYHKDLTRNQAYALGTLALAGPEMAWLYFSPMGAFDGPRAAALVFVVTGLGGASVVFAYAADAFIREHNENKLHSEISDGERDRPA